MKVVHWVLVSASACLLSPGGIARAAGPHDGVLTRIEGEAELLTGRSESAEGQSPRVRFKGSYYTARVARVGDPMAPGDVLRTPPGSRALVIFPNGDQISVAPGTSYEMSAPKGSSGPQVGLAYGKIRAVVSKEGPRNKMLVRTRAATMGVRGTDFFVDVGAPGKDTQVAVIRGEVAVAPTFKKKAQPIPVKSGFSASVPKPPEPKEAADPAQGGSLGADGDEPAAATGSSIIEEEVADLSVSLHETTKTELAVIREQSTVRKEAPDMARASVPTDTDRKLASIVSTLEKKAVETTVADIKAHNPALLKKIQADQAMPSTPEALNDLVVESSITRAPAEINARKIELQELDRMEKEAFDKFFKGVTK